MKPTPVWCANLTLLYTEFPFLERPARAREDGFTHVEFWWPSGVELDKLAEAIQAAEVDVALMNINSGDMAAGERGFFNRPERHDQILAWVEEAVNLALEVGCRQLNCPVGNDTGGETGAGRQQQLDSAVVGLKAAAQVAGAHGIRLNVEALNNIDNPLFLLHSTEAAIELISAVDESLGLQFDAYHMARMGEDIVEQAVRHGSSFAHVQIADFPGRNELGTGDLPIAEFVDAALNNGYSGVFALEYNPLTSTRKGISDMRTSGILR